MYNIDRKVPALAKISRALSCTHFIYRLDNVSPIWRNEKRLYKGKTEKMALKCEKLKRRLDGFELCGISADGNGIDYRCREKRGLWV